MCVRMETVLMWLPGYLSERLSVCLSDLQPAEDGSAQCRCRYCVRRSYVCVGGWMDGWMDGMAGGARSAA